MKPANKLASMRILLVETDRLVRDSLSLAFKQSGCIIQPVDSTKKGLKALGNENFDIIICDFSLPEMDGLAFFKSVNTLPKKCLKVLITTDISKNLSTESEAAGVHKVIEKPFAFKKLIETLNVLIDQR